MIFTSTLPLKEIMLRVPQRLYGSFPSKLHEISEHFSKFERAATDFPTLCIVSMCQEPYLNLALEEWLLRFLPESISKCLYLYCNRPCIVIGRHQNPWYECSVNRANFSQSQISNFPSLLRRNSGGGTVYHDTGNANYTYYTTKQAFSRSRALHYISKRLEQAFPNRLKDMHSLHVSEHNDLLVDSKWKISGSAYRVTLNRAYHHGTMLINSNLEELKAALVPSFNRDLFKLGAVTQSRPSPVGNLSQFCPQLSTTKDFFDIFSRYDVNTETIFITEQDIHQLHNIHIIIQELHSWDWIFGKTPNFKLYFPKYDLDLLVENGRIVNMDVAGRDRESSKLFDLLINKFHFR
jgi:lipoyltransferase/lipoate-protein ligase